MNQAGVIVGAGITPFVLITLTLLIIKNSPAKGYELSIYTSTPFLAWIFLIVSATGGISIILHQAFIGDKKSNWWIIGFLILILNYQ